MTHLYRENVIQASDIVFVTYEARELYFSREMKKIPDTWLRMHFFARSFPNHRFFLRSRQNRVANS